MYIHSVGKSAALCCECHYECVVITECAKVGCIPSGTADKVVSITAAVPKVVTLSIVG